MPDHCALPSANLPLCRTRAIYTLAGAGVIYVRLLLVARGLFEAAASATGRMPEMAVVVAGGGRTRAEETRLHWREQQEQRSPDMALPRPRPARVAVVYYISRNGRLDHPHFMEVVLRSPDGLFLRDVSDRLDALRGKGMARMYSWASKRSYRNGFVWHDLADDDYIHPAAGREYVLKGTERLHRPIQLPLLDAAAASTCSSVSQETVTSSSSGWERGSAARQKKGEAELGEYSVYKSKERAADAATQTDDIYRVRGGRGHQRRAQEELSREETSPPTASTSPETLEPLIKADGRVVASSTGGGRARASSVLMQLISCGSVSVKGALTTPLMPRGRHYRPRCPPRPPASAAVDMPTYRHKVVQDREYFSGGLMETKRSSDVTSQDMAVLRRSSSHNADRAQKVEPAREAVVDLHDRCIPRNPARTKKDGYLVVSVASGESMRLGA